MSEDADANGLIPEDGLHQSVIALSISSTSMGMAWYDELSNSILVDNIPLTADDLDDSFNLIKHDCKPTLFALHSKIVANKQLMGLILTKEGNDDTSNDDEKHMYDFIVPKASSWRADTAMEMICSKLMLRDSMKAMASYEEHYHLIAAKIPIDNLPIQQALGSLLIYIQSNILSLEDEVITISSLGEYQRKKYMRIDDNALRLATLPYIIMLASNS
jgi:hypothetical protein